MSIDLGAGANTLSLNNGANTGTVSNIGTLIGGTGTDTITLRHRRGERQHQPGRRAGLARPSATSPTPRRWRISSTITGGQRQRHHHARQRPDHAMKVDLGGGSNKLTLANGGDTGTVSNVNTLIGGTGTDTITLATSAAQWLGQPGGRSGHADPGQRHQPNCRWPTPDTVQGGTGGDTIVLSGTRCQHGDRRRRAELHHRQHRGGHSSCSTRTAPATAPRWRTSAPPRATRSRSTPPEVRPGRQHLQPRRRRADARSTDLADVANATARLATTLNNGGNGAFVYEQDTGGLYYSANGSFSGGGTLIGVHHHQWHPRPGPSTPTASRRSTCDRRSMTTRATKPQRTKRGPGQCHGGARRLAARRGDTGRSLAAACGRWCTTPPTIPISVPCCVPWANAGEAAAAYRRAIALDPQFAAAPYNLGNLLSDAGRLRGRGSRLSPPHWRRGPTTPRPATRSARCCSGAAGWPRRRRRIRAAAQHGAALGRATDQSRRRLARPGTLRRGAAGVAGGARHRPHARLGARQSRRGLSARRLPHRRRAATCDAIALAPKEHRWITNLAVALADAGAPRGDRSLLPPRPGAAARLRLGPWQPAVRAELPRRPVGRSDLRRIPRLGRLPRARPGAGRDRST